MDDQLDIYRVNELQAFLEYRYADAVLKGNRSSPGNAAASEEHKAIWVDLLTVLREYKRQMKFPAGLKEWYLDL